MRPGNSISVNLYGPPLDDDAPGIQAPGLNFTAYLKVGIFSKLLAEKTLLLSWQGSIPSYKSTRRIKTGDADIFSQAIEREGARLSQGMAGRGTLSVQRRTAVTTSKTRSDKASTKPSFNVSSYLRHFDELIEKRSDRSFGFSVTRSREGPQIKGTILDEVLGLPAEKTARTHRVYERTTRRRLSAPRRSSRTDLNSYEDWKLSFSTRLIQEKVLERAQLHREQ